MTDAKEMIYEKCSKRALNYAYHYIKDESDRRVVDVAVGIGIEETKKEIIKDINKWLDPEIISHYGKTFEERFAIGNYLRDRIRLL